MALGMAAVLCAMTGCGKADESATGQEENIIRLENLETGGESTGTEGSQEEGGEANAGPGNSQKEDSVWVESPVDGGNTGMKEIESETELEGSVQSIGESSMVVSKIHTYVDESNDAEVEEIAVESAVGGDELITVYFSDNTQFIVRTVKNGGANGDSDVEDRDGTASDVKENNTVLMTGGYEGEDFRAEQVIIYHFV